MRQRRFTKMLLVVFSVGVFHLCAESFGEVVAPRSSDAAQDKLYTGTMYYVSAEGDDANDGRSPKTPWRSIAHVNDRSFQPGDGILFRRGDTWREPMKISSSGNADGYITFGAYGDGPRPRLLGSAQAVDWRPVDGAANVWESATEVPNPFDYYASEIWFEEKDGSVTWGTRQGSGHTGDDNAALLARLKKEYDAVWIGDPKYNGPGHVYVFATANPATLYRAVEAPVHENIIRLNDQDYVAIDSLVLRYGLGRGVYENYGTSKKLAGFIARNCEIGYFGIKNGANMYGLSLMRADILIAGNEIHDCGRRGISLHGYDRTPPAVIENVVIERNHFHHGFHTTGVDSMNGGSHTIRNFIVRHNLFEGDPAVKLARHKGGDGTPGSNSLWIGNSNDAGQISDIQIYGNVFTFAHSSAVKLVGLSNAGVYNNTFYGFNPSMQSDAGLIWLGNCRDVVVKNNIFVKNTNDDTGSSYPRRPCIKKNDDMAGSLVIDNNLYYAPADDAWLIRSDGGSKEHFRRGQWNEYIKTGFDVHSPPPADPQFVDPDGGDFHLRTGSSAIGAGVPIPGVTHDFDGKPYDQKKPNLGAFAR